MKTSQKIKFNQDKIDKKISIALMASFVILAVQYFILIYFKLMDTNFSSTVQLLSKLLVGLAYLYALPSVLKRTSISFITAYSVAIFIFLFQYMLFFENRDYIVSLVFPFFFMCLPAFIYTRSIKNFDEFFKLMKISSYIILVISVIIGFFVLTGRVYIGYYSMTLSYYVLIPAIIFIDELMTKFSHKGLLFVILSLLIIIGLGSRGPILCIITFTILKFVKQNKKKTYVNFFMKFCVIVTGILSFLFFKEIMMLLYNFLMKFGINSRTLFLFLHDGVYLSNRDVIFMNVIDDIIQNPLLGIGVSGDRRVLDGAYVHNFFIEIIANFGIILGSFIIVALIIFIVKSLLTRDNRTYRLVIIWFSLGFIHLMVSSSYLIDIKFWVFLGLLFNPNLKTSKFIIRDISSKHN